MERSIDVMRCVWFLFLCLTIKVGRARNLLQVGFGGKTTRFDRFDGMCRGYDGILITFEFQSLKNIDNKIIMNCTFTVKEDIPSPPTLTIDVKRCRSKDNLDTCEEFHKFTTKQYCKMVASDSELWAPFFKTMQPRWQCPLKKGVYTAVNSTFDVTAFLLFPVDGWFWKVRADMFDGVTGKRIFCLVLDSQVVVKKVARN